MILMRPRFDRPASVPLKICIICGEKLYRGSVSDQCQWHVKRGRECTCGALIRNENISGLCIKCLRATSSIKQRDYDEHIARIKKLVKAQPVGISMQVVGYAAAIFNLKRDDITGHRQFHVFVEARCVVVVILRERQFSYPQIGRTLGGRDHSTIVNLYQKFNQWADANPAMRPAVAKIREALAGVDAAREAARSAMAQEASA